MVSRAESEEKKVIDPNSDEVSETAAKHIIEYVACFHFKSKKCLVELERKIQVLIAVMCFSFFLTFVSICLSLRSLFAGQYIYYAQWGSKSSFARFQFYTFFL